MTLLQSESLPAARYFEFMRKQEYLLDSLAIKVGERLGPIGAQCLLYTVS